MPLFARGEAGLLLANATGILSLPQTFSSLVDNPFPLKVKEITVGAYPYKTRPSPSCNILIDDQ